VVALSQRTSRASVRLENDFFGFSPSAGAFPDGSNILAPLTSLDVARHEMTHGITSQTAGLTYEGESGGLNEATSDIFGSLVEYYANSAQDPGDYLIGETLYTPGTPGDALRYMHQPSLDGKSPDCWSSSLAALDVHYSSGVANHFFYLLAEGSNPAGGPPPTTRGRVRPPSVPRRTSMARAVPWSAPWPLPGPR
jgi:Zn-dependent metalloprotease